MKNVVHCILGFLISTLLTACNTPSTFVVHVDSFRGETNSGFAYRLVPPTEDIEEDASQFQAFANATTQLLSQHGFQLVESAAADIEIALSYSMSEPRFHTYTYSTPLWRKTGICSRCSPSRCTCGSPPHTTRESYWGRGYEVAGTTQRTSYYVTYTRTLKLLATDLRTTPNQLAWETSARSVGSSDDLDRVFPVMLSAISPHLATNTDRPVIVNLKEAASQF